MGWLKEYFEKDFKEGVEECREELHDFYMDMSEKFSKGINSIKQTAENIHDFVHEDLLGKEPEMKVVEPDSERKILIEMEKSYDPNESKESREQRKQNFIKKYMKEKSKKNSYWGK